MKNLFYSSIFFLAIFSISCSEKQSQNSESNEVKLSTFEASKRVDSLLNLMTLEEKVGQLVMYNGFWEATGPAPSGGEAKERYENIKNGKVGAMLNVLTVKEIKAIQKLAVENSRLGIPLVFGYDVIHGYKTMFPVPLAQASSWDPEVARKGAEVAAQEAAAAGLHWTFSPMIDISRDARWGRIMEGAGEDPYLTSVMAAAWVHGYQGDDLTAVNTIAACAKHFAAYGLAEGGRDYNTADIGQNTLHNIVLPPFKAATEAGVATIMNSFNDIDGIPATGHEYILRDVLKNKWNFQGMVVSDWGSIPEMIAHGYAEGPADAAKLAIKAGTDMDMATTPFENHLQDLVESGEVSEEVLDEAVKRVLQLKENLGLFDDPYKYLDSEREKSDIYNETTKAVAYEAAVKSMVLLKNEGNILPLKKDMKIAVIGELAESRDVPLGNWRAQAIENSAVSILDGIKRAVTDSGKVRFAQGYQLVTGERAFVKELQFVEDDGSGFKKAVRLAKWADVVVMNLGEDCYQTGEGRSQVDVSLKGRQVELFKMIKDANENTVVVLQNGRPLAIPEIMKEAPAVLEAWFGGSEAGTAVADILFGDVNPTGKLPVSFPYKTGQEPLYYNIKNTGRPGAQGRDANTVFWSHYTDVPNEALIPFGFGLSYTKFDYANMAVSDGESGPTVSVELTNSGDVKGTETVQIYIRDHSATWIQPILRLVDYEKVELEPGQSKVVSFSLSEEDLGFVHPDGSFYAEPGEFSIFVGSNSRDLTEKKWTKK